MTQPDATNTDTSKSQNDAWTRVHDLALIYVALAHGTDQKLDDAELTAITEALQSWRDDLSHAQVLEVVMEALAVYLGGSAETEVRRSISALGDLLSEPSRKRVLDDIVRIARADGVVLGNERGFIEAVATQWNLRADTLNLERDGGTGHGDDTMSWSLLHDVALLGLVVAHGADGDLSDAEVQMILHRLAAWQPDLAHDDLREVLRVALEYYGAFEDADELQESVSAVADYLTPGQRLAVLDDLVAIARAEDGATSEEAITLLHAFGAAWSVPIRLERGAK